MTIVHHRDFIIIGHLTVRLYAQHFRRSQAAACLHLTQVHQFLILVILVSLLLLPLDIFRRLLGQCRVGLTSILKTLCSVDLLTCRSFCEIICLHPAEGHLTCFDLPGARLIISSIAAREYECLHLTLVTGSSYGRRVIWQR